MRKALGICFMLLVLAGAVTAYGSFDGPVPPPQCTPKTCPGQ